jgi:PAS domain-containing protein
MPLSDSNARSRFFAASPNPYLVLDRDLNIVDANQAYLASTKRELADIVGRWAWDAFPTNAETLRQSVASFERVICTRQPDTMALLRFDIPRPEAEGGGSVRKSRPEKQSSLP